MRKRNARYETQKAVTVRLSHADFLALLQKAEEMGTTNADVIRTAWGSYQEKSEVELKFKKLESRIVKQMFEVCSATLGLNDSERKAAIKEFKRQNNKRGES